MDSVRYGCIFQQNILRYKQSALLNELMLIPWQRRRRREKMFQIPWQNQTKHFAIESMENTFNAHFLLLYKIYVSYWIFAMSFTIFDVSCTRSGSSFGFGSFLIHCLNHPFEMHQVNFRAWTFCVEWLADDVALCFFSFVAVPRRGVCSTAIAFVILRFPLSYQFIFVVKWITLNEKMFVWSWKNENTYAEMKIAYVIW